MLMAHCGNGNRLLRQLKTGIQPLYFIEQLAQAAWNFLRLPGGA